MKRQLIVLNTLVFSDYIKKGFKQEQLLEFVDKCNVSNIEVRREYIKELDSELEAICKLSKKMNIKVFYSVPKTIFVDGKVDKENLNKYLKEAKQMNCTNVKLNIGDYENYKGDLKEDLKEIVDSNINITVENDQTEQNGTYKNILRFLNDCKTQSIDIGYVYDIGNWYWVSEDEIENAKQLKEFTTYIHLKDIKKTNKGNMTLPLDKGNIKWREVMSILPKNIEVGLEYPCDDISLVQEDIKKLLEL